MDFSIIIPAFNAEQFIYSCCMSALQQEYPANQFEVIVVDDNSSDNTIKIVESLQKSYSNLRLIKHLLNKKQGGARNTGIKESKGDFLLFLDADDCYIVNNVLLVFQEYLKRHNYDVIQSVSFKNVPYSYIPDQTKKYPPHHYRKRR